MKTSTKTTSTVATQPKRGTIGFRIAQLAKEFGDGTKGIYILEQALLKVTGAKSLTYQDADFNDMLMSETPLYKKHFANEGKIFASLGQQPEVAHNVFNPDNIEAGDQVRLANDDKMKNHEVVTVSGKNKNKVFCKSIGYEVYASCFILVRKGEYLKK